MAEGSELITALLASITPIIAKEGLDAAKTLTRKAVDSFHRKGVGHTDELTQLVEVIKKNPPPLAQMEMNMDTLSRWFEIPRDDFERLPKDRLDPEVPIRHVYLEQLFADWFKEFGYDVKIGNKMLGIEGWEFVPDIYAEMSNLHGIFQVAINFVCSDPPNTNRVSFCCESLEAFAMKVEPSYSARDIFMIVTPFKLTPTAHSVLSKEDKDHAYFVIKIEGSDLYVLQQAGNREGRLKLLQNIAKEAYGPDAKKTWI